LFGGKACRKLRSDSKLSKRVRHSLEDRSARIVLKRSESNDEDDEEEEAAAAALDEEDESGDFEADAEVSRGCADNAGLRFADALDGAVCAFAAALHVAGLAADNATEGVLGVDNGGGALALE